MPNTLDEPVASIASYDLVTAPVDGTLRELARAMIDNACSALVVFQRNGNTAIVTEYDLVQSIAAGSDPDAEWATDLMTRDVIEVDALTSIADVAELMQEAGIRHVIVRADDDRLAIVSLRDLLDPLLSIE